MRHLRRKLTLKAHGEQVVLVKRKQERINHVWMKAFLWALYLPEYPDISVEVDVEDKYKPDVVALSPHRGRVQFWGEAGRVSREKLESLIARYPHTHITVAKWNRSLAPTRSIVEDVLVNTAREAPADLLSFPADSTDRFVDGNGTISVDWNAVDRQRL